MVEERKILLKKRKIVWRSTTVRSLEPGSDKSGKIDKIEDYTRSSYGTKVL